MIRKLIILAAAALLVAPAALADNGQGKSKGSQQSTANAAAAASLPNGAQRCAAQRTSLTAAVFATTFGANDNDKNAFGKCVAQINRENAQAKASANAACRAEQSDANFAAGHDGKTFAQFYGGEKNAFGKCVSQKAKAKVDANVKAKVQAAKACLTERRANAETFKSQYKTLGRCVAAKSATS